METKSAHFVFSREREIDFLKQAFFSDPQYDNYILFEKPLDAGFEDAHFFNQGLGATFSNVNDIDTASCNQYFNWNPGVMASDTDILIIYQQIMMNKLRKWTEYCAPNRMILTLEMDQLLLNSLGNKQVPDSLELVKKTYNAKGRLEMSHPIFYDNYSKALFSLKTSINHNDEKDECMIYFKNNAGKWVLDKHLMTKLRKPLKVG